MENLILELDKDARNELFFKIDIEFLKQINPKFVQEANLIKKKYLPVIDENNRGEHGYD